jgi:hypothetical protein
LPIPNRGLNRPVEHSTAIQIHAKPISVRLLSETCDPRGRGCHTICHVRTVRSICQEALAPGKHTIEFDFTYEGPGFGKGGTGVLKVDDKEVDNRKIPHTIPFLVPFDETFDIGLDTRTPVDDNDYQVPFHFTGKLDKLTFKLEPEQLTEEDRKVMHQYVIRGKD